MMLTNQMMVLNEMGKPLHIIFNSFMNFIHEQYFSFEFAATECICHQFPLIYCIHMCICVFCVPAVLIYEIHICWVFLQNGVFFVNHECLMLNILFMF